MDVSWTEYLTPTQYAQVYRTSVYVILARIKAGELSVVYDDEGIKIKVVYRYRL